MSAFALSSESSRNRPWSRFATAAMVSWVVVGTALLGFAAVTAAPSLGLNHSAPALAPAALATAVPAAPPSPAYTYGDPPPSVGAIGNIPVGAEPEFASYNPTNQLVYVPNWGANNVSVIRNSTVIASIPVGSIPFSTTYDPANGDIYVVNEGSGNLTVLHGLSVVANLFVGTTPQFAAYDGYNQYLYISNSGSNNVSVYNGTTFVGTIPVGTHPSSPVVAQTAAAGGGGGWSPAFVTPAASPPDIYVPNTGSNNVTVISGGLSILGSVNVGTSPQFAAWDPNNVWLYVPNEGSGTVSVLAGTTVLYTIPVGSEPWSASLAASGEVYVPNFNSADVSIIGGASVSSVVATVHTGGGPEFATPIGGTIYIPDTSGGVTVLSGNVLLATVPAGLSPIFATYNPTNQYLYIQNFGGSNITLVSPGALVTFHEVGLLTGTPWGVTAGPTNTSYASTSTLIKAFAAMGTFHFKARPPAGYALARVVGLGRPTQTSANITGATTLTLELGPPETLYINESVLLPTYPGLPASTSWSATIKPAVTGEAAGSSNSTTGTSMQFTIAKGAVYRFTIANPATYRAVPARGVVIMPAHAFSRLIRFAPQAVTEIFRETGLHTGTRWGVNITGPMNLDVNTTAASIVVHLINGTYTVTAWNYSALHPHWGSSATLTLTVAFPHAPVSSTVVYNSTAARPLGPVVSPPLELTPGTGPLLAGSATIARPGR